MKERIRNTIAEVLQINTAYINDDSNFYTDLLVDEYDMVDIVEALDLEFGIPISYKAYECRTVKDLCNLVVNMTL